MGYVRNKIQQYNDFSLKQINDNFMTLWLKVFGNIDIADLRNDVGKKLDIGENPAINSIAYDVGGNTTQIVQNSTSITSLAYDVGDNYSMIQQNADNILLKVGNDDIISAINLSPESITIASNNIDLYGVTRVYSNDNQHAYVEMGNNYGDLKCVNGSNTIFHIYNEGTGISMRSFGNEILSYNDAVGRTSARGNWNFSYANVSGLDIYTEGWGIDISSDGQISVDENDLDGTFTMPYFSGNYCYIDANSSGVVIRDSSGSELGTLAYI